MYRVLVPITVVGVAGLGISLRNSSVQDDPRVKESLHSVHERALEVEGEQGVDGFKVVYLHIPKTAGVSMIQASADAHVPSCTFGTGPPGKPPVALRAPRGWWCNCAHSCAKSKALAIVEKPFNTCQKLARAAGWDHPTWVALVRDPESWFYSAVGQYCAGIGRNEEPCTATVSGEVDYQTLLKNKWFEPKGKAPHVKYYFHGDSLQLSMLGDVMRQPRYMICSMAHRRTLLHMISGLLLQDDQIATDVRVNEVHWPYADRFRQRVPWEQVQGHYTNDTDFYNRVKQAGCISSKNLERIVKEAVANPALASLPDLEPEYW